MAVIVILAIIALIAVPIILNIIGSSKKSAVVRSGELYLSAVETAIARENLNNQFNPTTCIIGNDGNLTCDEDKTLTIQVNGSKPTSGIIELTSGKISKVTGMTLDDYELEKIDGRLKIVEQSIAEPDKEISCKVKSYLSEPKLYSGLIPVVYENNNWKVANITEKWYDYDSQEWANAVILKTGIIKNVGDVINVNSEVQGMFVWIPRYEYNYESMLNYAGGTQEQPGEIEVNFISKNQIQPTCKEYKLHPAFTFGDTELSGIWVGKFETTGTANAPTILPNETSLRIQNIRTQFITAQKFNTYINNSNIDFHMAKNSEWGAAAYLSQSKYGKHGNLSYIDTEKQVIINNCKNYITGIGADNQDFEASTTTCITNTYETAKGQAASTTGNITGIYDMSGGSTEYVMGILADSNGNPRSGRDSNRNSGFNGLLKDETQYSSGITFPEFKYFDLYTDEMVDKACNSEICYGHALSEIVGWYNTEIYFVNISSPWLIRGNNYNGNKKTTIFDFSRFHGSDDAHSFRVIIV